MFIICIISPSKTHTYILIYTNSFLLLTFYPSQCIWKLTIEPLKLTQPRFFFYSCAIGNTPKFRIFLKVASVRFFNLKNKIKFNTVIHKDDKLFKTHVIYIEFFVFINEYVYKNSSWFNTYFKKTCVFVTPFSHFLTVFIFLVLENLLSGLKFISSEKSLSYLSIFFLNCFPAPVLHYVFHIYSIFETHGKYKDIPNLLWHLTFWNYL